MSLVTLVTMVLFTSLGAIFGWRWASVALWTDTAPKWHRPHGVGRRQHRRRVKIRRQFWRLYITGLWSVGGAGVGVLMLYFGPFSWYR